MINEHNLKFDVAFTSVLKRAIKTLYLIQDGCDLHWIPVHRHWRLNERMYGGLQGLNKSETAAKHGEEQVKVPLLFCNVVYLILVIVFILLHFNNYVYICSIVFYTSVLFCTVVIFGFIWQFSSRLQRGLINFCLWPL